MPLLRGPLVCGLTARSTVQEIKSCTITFFDSRHREISAPLLWFPRLLHATLEQRANWELIGNGIDIDWPQVDEDIEVESHLAT